MKKVVFRRRSQKGPIRVFVYEQDPMYSLDCGSRKDFWCSGQEHGEEPGLDSSRIRLRHSWGRMN